MSYLGKRKDRMYGSGPSYKSRRLAGVTRRKPALAVQQFVHSRAPLTQTWRRSALTRTVQYGQREWKVIQDGLNLGVHYVDPTMSGFPSARCPLLNGIATGTDYNARIGRKIMMKSIALRYEIQMYMSDQASYNQANPQVVRVMLVYDKAPTGTTPPIWSDILDGNTAWNDAYSVSDTTPCFNNLSNRTRFVTLYDRLHNLGVIFNGAVGLSAGYNTGMLGGQFSVYVKKSLPTVFGGTGSTWSDIKEGALVLLVVGNQTQSGIPDSMWFNYNYRIRFTDD